MLNYEGIELALKKRSPSPQEVREILVKAQEAKGLSWEEAARLMLVQNDEEILMMARRVKENIYGKRLVLFAPLYLTNECVNNCLYCAFRRDNTDLVRKTLSVEETVMQAKTLEKIGQKRLLLVAGEHPIHSNVKEIVKHIEAIYAAGDIRRLNVNAAPLDVKEFKVLKAAKIGTYQVFQETYDPKTYRIMHPTGKKADYQYRLEAPMRALEAGIDDVGIGPLFGLYDWRFELLATLQHAEYMDKVLGVGPHTISVPRLRPAVGSLVPVPPYAFTDNEFKRVVAILRLAVPYTGIILSTRERSLLRDELIHLGVSQLSAGSRTSPGGYEETNLHSDESQFALEDTRSLPEVVKSIAKAGYLPSFCTACYRRQRTGEAFMELAKTGQIKDLCQANAILTFKEYLLHEAPENLRTLGNEIITRHLQDIPKEFYRQETLKRLGYLEDGRRDQYM